MEILDKLPFEVVIGLITLGLVLIVLSTLAKEGVSLRCLVMDFLRSALEKHEVLDDNGKIIDETILFDTLIEYIRAKNVAINCSHIDYLVVLLKSPFIRKLVVSYINKKITNIKKE